MTGVAINVEQKFIATCSTDGYLICVSLTTMKIFRRMTFDLRRTPYHCIAISGSLIAVGGDSKIHL